MHLIDGFPISLCHYQRAQNCQLFMGEANFGYCASKNEKYDGFHGHLVVSAEGIITGFCLTAANVSEREALWDVVDGISGLLIGDKGYLSNSLQSDLNFSQLNLQTPKRSNMIDRRPRLKGKRLPNLEQVLIDADTDWSKITLANWYGETERTVEITTGVAVWYHTGLPVVPIRWVLVRDPLGKFKPQALLCTHQEYQPQQILEWFARRWQLEVTFEREGWRGCLAISNRAVEEVRRHLGLETQRQWSDLAIARTTPLILGLFSIVTLLAHHLQANFTWTTRQKSWYSKPLPTFSDALALVRRFLWAGTFSTSSKSTDMIKVPRPLFNRLRDIAIYAA
ncbi:MAG: transposase [Cyanobacteria bacterium J06638_38]